MKLIKNLTLTLALGITAATATAKSPLNYVILLADDISSDSIGCYSSANPHTTPNIDKLASEGIRFTNMFVSEAVCGPARAELYTGLQPHRNGVYRNHMTTKEGTKSIVHHLKDLGYRVGLSGKTHIRPDSVYPFENVKGLYQNCNARGPIKESWEDIKAFMSKSKEEPFCLVLASIHAHSPWDAGDTSHWELDELVLPKNLVDTQKTRDLYREYLAEVRLFDDQVGQAEAILKELGIDQNTVLIVLDENGTGMPGGKWTNYDWGVRSACIMKWPKSYKANFETDAIAQYCDIVPTLIDAAGGTPEDLDGKSLMPIVRKETQEHRDKAFFVYNSGKEGPPFSSRAVTNGKFKFMWNLKPGGLYAVRTINGFDYGYEDTKMPDRHVRQIYLSWLEAAKTDPKAASIIKRYRERPEYQLYDLDADPYELNNLADSGEHNELIETFKSEITAWMKQQNDDGDLNQKKGSKNKNKK